MLIVDCYSFNSVSTGGDVARIFGCSTYLSKTWGGGEDGVDKFSDEDIYTCEGMSDFCQEA